MSPDQRAGARRVPTEGSPSTRRPTHLLHPWRTYRCDHPRYATRQGWSASPSSESSSGSPHVGHIGASTFVRFSTSRLLRLAARLLRLNPQKLAGLDPAALTDFGHLLETFVVGEVRKQASWLNESVSLGHWRTSDGAEVDLVIEYDDGTVIGLEVKASERASASDFRSLEQFRQTLGSRLAAGIILTTGHRSYTYADGLHVMPIDRLWTPVAP